MTKISLIILRWVLIKLIASINEIHKISMHSFTELLIAHLFWKSIPLYYLSITTANKERYTDSSIRWRQVMKQPFHFSWTLFRPLFFNGTVLPLTWQSKYNNVYASKTFALWKTIHYYAVHIMINTSHVLKQRNVCYFVGLVWQSPLCI